jgi:hypothetical protein
MMYELCILSERRMSVQQKKNVSKEERKETESEREKEKKRKKKINAKGRKYLADQVDYWYCCLIRDHLYANLSRNTS